jgi:hypothetical protein
MTTSNITPSPLHRNPARQPKDPRTLAARAEISLYNRGAALRSLVLESAAAWGDPVRHNKVLNAMRRLLREAMADRRRLLEASHGLSR